MMCTKLETDKTIKNTLTRSQPSKNLEALLLGRADLVSQSPMRTGTQRC